MILQGVFYIAGIIFFIIGAIAAIFTIAQSLRPFDSVSIIPEPNKEKRTNKHDDMPMSFTEKLIESEIPPYYPHKIPQTEKTEEVISNVE